MLHAVVMAGGSGTRFWPMSRQQRPKHLLALAGEGTLIQQAVRRIAPLVAPDRTWVITGASHAEEVRRQLPHLPPESIVAEPCRRDTAPCIGLAAAIIGRLDPDATMIVMPADQVIEPEPEFRRCVGIAESLVAEDPRRLVTLGIAPDRPATGYGYIHRGDPLDQADSARVFHVQSFREKPARDLAEKFLASGEFYWNSGIFVWSARTIREELRQARPALDAAVDRIAAAWGAADREQVLAREYTTIEPISIDYAVLERAAHVAVVEATFRWDDVGSWGAIKRLRGADAAGNTVAGRHCGLDTSESIVLTDADHVVATIGVHNLVIVQCGNATLVADRDREESVKQLVESMKQNGLETFL
jgi:mannose-1-phosphate guanylyltransferase